MNNTIDGGSVGSVGVTLSDVTNLFVYQNTIQSQSGAGVSVGLGTPTIDQNVIKNNGSGVLLRGDGGATVRGNHISGNKSDGVSVSFTEVGGGCTVEDNKIHSNGGNGVLVTGSQTHSCLIQDNVVHDNKGVGVSITGGSQHQVMGNLLKGNSVDLFWDGSSGASWFQNVFVTSSPVALPVCP